MGGILFHPIYWQTACLLQRSGALDGKTSDYNKIAKAVSLISSQGVNIKPVAINKSEKEFVLEEATNSIYFGLSAIKGLKEKAIENIIEHRPFVSLWDFIVKTNADVTSITTLIKSGAFDDFGPRIDTIEQFARYKSDQKMGLNGRNYLMLSRDGHWPQDTEELVMAQRVFNFTQYLKDLKYKLDDRACEFLDEIGYQHNGESIEESSWKTYYDFRLRPMKQYLIDNQEEMLEKVNQSIIKEWAEKYFPNENIALWEIETMGLCFAGHPLQYVTNSIDNFEDLPQEPVVANIFRTKTGRNVPMFSLTMICGIAIAKDKLHSSFTILTPTGPVEVKLRKESFAHYDAQISKVEGNHKKVIEKSWFNRGNMLIIHGMRQDDQFIAKTYKNSAMQHTIYKILSIDETGKCQVQKDRKKGKEEYDESSDGEHN